MEYIVDDWIFSKIPNVQFGIIVAENIKNSITFQEDSVALDKAEDQLRNDISIETLKTYKDFAAYRDALISVGINPNKYTNSVEAMSKRVLKGGNLSRINALVDLCNAVALKFRISLGGHDLDDIEEDLSVRLSETGDIFLPFGETEYEQVEPGELVFTSGNKIQTRQWLWRQSEQGKLTLESKNVFFQLVGFEGELNENLTGAMRELEEILSNRFNATFSSYIVSASNRSIEFNDFKKI